ncbi:hypothetical protein PV326_000657, partial [Microctonus aethiopoides]
IMDDYGKIIEKCHISELKPYYPNNLLQGELRVNEEKVPQQPSTSSSSLYSGDGRGGERVLPVPGATRRRRGEESERESIGGDFERSRKKRGRVEEISDGGRQEAESDGREDRGEEEENPDKRDALAERVAEILAQRSLQYPVPSYSAVTKIPTVPTPPQPQRFTSHTPSPNPP